MAAAGDNATTTADALVAAATGQRCGQQCADGHGREEPAGPEGAQSFASFGSCRLSFAFLALLASALLAVG